MFRLKAAADRSGATVLMAREVGVRAVPAGRGVAGAEGFDIVEARGTVAAAAAPAGAAFGLGDLDIGRRQFVEEARGDRGRPRAVNAPVGGEIEFGRAAGAPQADMGEASPVLQTRAALFVQ